MCQPPSTRLWLAAPCDVAVQGFAVWTVLCNLLVLGGSRPVFLVAALPVLALTLTCLAGAMARRRGPVGALAALCDAAPIPPATPAVPGPLSLSAFRGVAALQLLVAGFLLFSGKDSAAAYAVVACGMAVLSLMQFSLPGPAADADPAGAEPLKVLLLGLVCAGITAHVSRPDIDEAFYFAMASSLHRFPDLPLLSFDPLHGDPSIALQMQAYRVHSLELLAGTLSAWLGPLPIRFMHGLFPAVASLLLPFALHRLARELAAPLATSLLVLTMGVLLTDAAVHRSFGNFAFLRFFQGKAIFVTLQVPLILAYGIRLGRKPSKRRLWLLSCATISAVGMTSIALPLAPLLSGIGVLTGMGPGGIRGTMRCLLGWLAASAYPLVVAFLTYVQMMGGRLHSLQERALSQAVATRPPEQVMATFERLLSDVIGKGAMAYAYGAACLLLPLCGPLRAARLAVTSCAVFLVLLGNPLLKPIVSQHVLGQSTYWRALWLLPLPMLLSTAWLSWPGALGRRPWLAALGVMLGCGLLFIASPRTTLSPENGVRPPFAGLKVEPAFAVARHAAQLLPPQGGVVAVPGQVGRYLPALGPSAFPVFVKASYLRRADRPMRELLHACVSGVRRAGCTAGPLQRALSALSVRVVGMPSGVRAQAVLEAMRAQGFVAQPAALGYHFWTAP